MTALLPSDLLDFRFRRRALLCSQSSDSVNYADAVYYYYYFAVTV